MALRPCLHISITYYTYLLHNIYIFYSTHFLIHLGLLFTLKQSLSHLKHIYILNALQTGDISERWILWIPLDKCKHNLEKKYQFIKIIDICKQWQSACQVQPCHGKSKSHNSVNSIPWSKVGIYSEACHLLAISFVCILQSLQNTICHWVL